MAKATDFFTYTFLTLFAILTVFSVMSFGTKYFIDFAGLCVLSFLAAGGSASLSNGKPAAALVCAVLFALVSLKTTFDISFITAIGEVINR